MILFKKVTNTSSEFYISLCVWHQNWNSLSFYNLYPLSARVSIFVNILFPMTNDTIFAYWKISNLLTYILLVFIFRINVNRWNNVCDYNYGMIYAGFSQNYIIMHFANVILFHVALWIMRFIAWNRFKYFWLQ